MTTDWEALELSSVSGRVCESWDRGAFDPRVPHRRREPWPGGVSESAHKGWGRGDGEAEADALEQHVLRMGQMGGRDAAGLAVDAERKMAKAYLTRNATRVSTSAECQQLEAHARVMARRTWVSLPRLRRSSYLAAARRAPAASASVHLFDNGVETTSARLAR